MLLVLLAAYNTQQALAQPRLWYSPFLSALAVIVFAALLQQVKRHDDP
jgi:hypothetical protein